MVVHGAGRRRPRRGLGRRAGSAERARRRRRRRSDSTPSRCASPTCRSAAGSGGACRSPSITSISACAIAKAMSPAPVKTVWSRENDIQHDYYRPAAHGAICRRAGRRAASRSAVAVGTMPAAATASRCSCPMRSPTSDAEGRDAAHPIRTGPWRSVLNSQHGFFKESFIDEMAHAAGKDPFEFRRDLLTDQPRFRAALETRRRDGRLGQPAARRAKAAALRSPKASAPSSPRWRTSRCRLTGGCGCGTSTRPWIAATSSTPTPRRRRSRAASSSACRPPCSARSRSRTAGSCSGISATTR